VIGMADLLTVAVIKDGLNHLAKNPHHLEYILGAFACEPLRSFVGKEHIKDCVEFVTQNRIQVAPYYELDMKRRPSIGVVASGREEQLFLADAGDDSRYNRITMPARVYAEFDAMSISDSRDELVVSAGLKLDKILWIGLILSNGKQDTRITGILVRDGENTVIYLKDKLPEGTSLRGWKAKSQPRGEGTSCDASMDMVNIQLQLASTGDPSVHRLLAIVVRYCLKRGRMMFESNGLQVPIISYTALLSSESSEIEWESSFTIEAKFTELYPIYDFGLQDDTNNINLHLIATPETITEERQEVEIA
jgi:hypothetical protein